MVTYTALPFSGPYGNIFYPIKEIGQAHVWLGGVKRDPRTLNLYSLIIYLSLASNFLSKIMGCV